VKHGREVILASPDASIPQRGEIWLVNFDPTVGTEIRKTRPAVVVSSDAVGRLPIKLVAPVTDWKEHFASNIWHVRIDPDRQRSHQSVSRRCFATARHGSPPLRSEVGASFTYDDGGNCPGYCGDRRIPITQKQGKGDRLLLFRSRRLVKLMAEKLRVRFVS
jgi:PemK-like, MazF-like toxin of type II toxin-antitoxin system